MEIFFMRYSHLLTTFELIIFIRLLKSICEFNKIKNRLQKLNAFTSVRTINS